MINIFCLFGKHKSRTEARQVFIKTINPQFPDWYIQNRKICRNCCKIIQNWENVQYLGYYRIETEREQSWFYDAKIDEQFIVSYY